MEMNNNNQNGAWKFSFQLIGFILCFAVPAAMLAIIFPSHLVLVVLIALTLLLASGGFILGLWWYHPEMTSVAKKQIITSALLVFIVLPSTFSIADVVVARDLKHFIIKLLSFARVAFVVYIPFFAGRAISRRKTNS